MVEIEGLHKKFGKLEVLRGISLTIPKGRSVSILGPNGSGKTTLIKSILGLVVPDKGSIKINGNSIEGNWDYRTQIGYLPQIARFPENLKVSELFTMISDLRQSTPDPSELVDQFQLKTYLNQPLRFLSGGTRQKVNAVLALMFDPAMYVFDEPTVGLDPVSRVKFREHVLQEKEKGKTVLLVTHLMNEIEEMADDVVFILDGTIAFNGSVSELKQSQNETNLDKAIAGLLTSRAHE